MDFFNNSLSLLMQLIVITFLAFYVPLAFLCRLICFVFVRPFSCEDLRGKVVLITGASSGIGEQLTYQYARKGASLVLTARREQSLKVVAEKARVEGAPDVLVIPADVSVELESKKVIEEAIAYFGKLNHLVVNAGILSSCLFEEITAISAFRQVMDVNFWGAVYPTYYAIPYLKNSRGNITVMSSIAGRAPPARMGIYNASKAAMIRFYETLQAEMGSDVKITILTPGWFSSELSKGKFLQKEGEMKVNEQVRDIQVGIFPVGDPEKYAEVIVEAACRGDKYVTWPSGYQILHIVMCIAPELFNCFSRLLYINKPGDPSSVTFGTKVLTATGAKKFLYPSSIQNDENKLSECEPSVIRVLE